MTTNPPAPGAPPPNPVIPGFHPDPSVCRVGADYYAACSSFEYVPGVPIFHSRDLVAWKQIGNALRFPGRPGLTSAASSGGIYAPTLRRHGGRFWLATTDASAGVHLIVTAADAAGPWSEPVVLDALPGIDPDLAWDEAGDCWFSYSVFPGEGRPGGIMQARIDPSTGAVLDAPRRIWSGTGLAYPEAPHLYRIGEFWYLLIAEGGTERGHAISVARGPNPWGPFEGCPANPVLSHRSTDSPIQSTGHGDLVRAADGSWWMLLLGTRPRGGTPAFHVLGRETFLTRVRWSEGWPYPERVVAGPGGDPAWPEAAEHDDFDAAALAPQWVAPRRPATEFSDLSARPGWLTLNRRAAESGSPTLDEPDAVFVGRRQQHLRSRVRALVDAAHGRGGLAIRIDERHHYEMEAGAGRVRCHARVGPFSQEFGAVDVPGGEVVLWIETVPTAAGFGSPGAPPDQVTLGVELAGERLVLGEVDGRYLSTEVAGGFTGRMIGLYAQAGSLACDWFAYEGWPAAAT